MIITEKMTINGRNFIHTYSDEGYMIERDGARYADAIDPAEFGRVYTETDEKIETPDPEIEEEPTDES